MANALLGSTDTNIRFFGALTYIVKLNQEGTTMSKEFAHEVSMQLISWVAKLYDDKPMTSQKICTALSLLYMQPPTSADRCVFLVTAALHNGAAVEGAVGEAVPLDKIISLLEPAKLLMLLRFCKALAEEGANRIKHDDKQISALSQDRAETSLADAAQVMRYALEYSQTKEVLVGTKVFSVGTKELLIRNHALDCLVSWTAFSMRARSMALEKTNLLRDLLPSALDVVGDWEDSESSEIDVPMDLLGEMLTAYPAFFRPGDLRQVSDLICSEWGKEQIYTTALVEPDFVRFLLAYGEADLPNLAAATDDADVEEILEMMHGLLTIEGYASVEDSFILDAQQFWAAYIEFVVDTQFGEAEESSLWLSHAKSHITRAVEELWAKVQFPPPEEYESWPSEDRQLFNMFRTDIKDVFQVAHTALGVDLLQAFMRLAFRSMEQQNWIKLEAALFGLNAVAENLSDGEEEDNTVSQLFNSSLYSSLTSDNESIPVLLRRTAMTMIGKYDSYFERHAESLPGALNFLFKSLEMKSMAEVAARTISTLCKACRNSLTSELEAFLQQYQRFLSWASANSFTKEKIISAVAAISQALPTDPEKDRALGRLIDFVQVDIRASVELMARGNSEESLARGLSGVQCLAGIARSFEETIEVVDLDGDGIEQNYWWNGNGHETQKRIPWLLNVMIDFWPSNGDVIEQVCQVLRAGYKETTPGPFVFQPSVTYELLNRFKATTPRIEHVLNTYCAFLRAHTPRSSRFVDEEAAKVLSHVATLMHELSDPREDPEIAQACVEVLTRYMPRYTSVLVNFQSPAALEVALNFTIMCIKAPEPLPKRAAATFWVGKPSLFLISPIQESQPVSNSLANFLKQGTLLHLTSQPQPLQQQLDSIILHFGQALTTTLIAQIGGTAMRSDVEMLADPIKKLYTRHPRVKTWFENALMLTDEAAMLDHSTIMKAELGYVARMSIPERRTFFSGLGVSGDLGTVRKVCGDFWAKARAAAFQPGNAWAITERG